MRFEDGGADHFEQLALDPKRLAQKARRVLKGKYAPNDLDYKFVGQTLLDHELGYEHAAKEVVFHKPGGCEACGNKGFLGRRGIYELMLVDDVVGPLILKNADALTVKRAARQAGMDSLRDDGARKVLSGMTTVEEVLAATQEDVLVDE